MSGSTRGVIELIGLSMLDVRRTRGMSLESGFMGSAVLAYERRATMGELLDAIDR